MTLQQNPLPELLAPAGSMAALEAAIDGGADAVYLGTEAFNARMRAGNFTDEEIGRALELCRAFGVKAYITLNIRLADGEISKAVALGHRLAALGADAFIVADAGLGERLRQTVPEVELHASTQMSARTAQDAGALARAGYTRMVCPRELSFRELTSLCAASPIPIEMFIHGAYCVSYSGQCLMSAVMGGRSGNRGECAQPCRLPYTMNGQKGYPLSLRDMSLAGHVPEIIASGAASLKIEGRQKTPEYVYQVTKIWRSLLDQRRSATEEEWQLLSSAFSRNGFSDGYFTQHHKNMLGVRTLQQFHQSQTAPYEGLSRRVPVTMQLTLRVGQPAALQVAAPAKTVTVYSEKPLPEGGQPLREENARKNAGRLGTTPFVLERFQMATEGAPLFTLSMLNNLRRKAIDALLAPPAKEQCERDHAVQSKDQNTVPIPVQPICTAQFLSEDQITPLCEQFFGELYLPAGDHRRGAVLPPALSGQQWDLVWDRVENAPYVLVHTPGQLAEAVRRGLIAHPSLRFNVYNSDTAAWLADQGAQSVFVSPELAAGGMTALKSPVPKAAAVYGRLPVMLTMRCALSDGGRTCRGKRGKSLCHGELRDRKGVCFSVTGMEDCTNVIWNSVPLYMADRKDRLARMGLSRYHFIFTTETGEECDRTIRAWQKGLPPQDGKIRRI